MRCIAKLQNKEEAFKFSFYLKRKQIQNFCEQEQKNDQKPVYLIWVEDEDHLDYAKQLLEEFQKNPDDQKYAKPPEAPSLKIDAIHNVSHSLNQPKKRRSSGVTIFFLALCFFFFFMNNIQRNNLAKGKDISPSLLITPLMIQFLYDVPLPIEEMVKKIWSGSIHSPESLKDESIDEFPMWRGWYNLWVAKFQGKSEISGPMFRKIKQGQIWRFFTPCVLHGDYLHIIFNMLWLWVLGKQMEQKMNKLKMVVFILLAGCISNTFQYLFSGPFFLGFSGVITTMAGFIWMRQKVAPWEGYAIHNSTFLFLGIFIFGLFLLQIVLFFLQVFSITTYAIAIGNASHISGGVLGILLGRSSVFSWSPRES